MSKLGSLIGAAALGLLAMAASGNNDVFWLFFCFSAIIGFPIGAILDAAYHARKRREQKESNRFARYNQMIQRTIRKVPQTVVNIDARAVHYHTKEAPKGFVDKP